MKSITMLYCKNFKESVINLCLLVVNNNRGFSAARGALTPNIDQAETKKAMISIAQKVIILCDSSKIGRSSFVKFADIQDIDIVITDKNISEETKLDLELKGINIIVAE